MGLISKIINSFIRDSVASALVELYQNDNANVRIFNPPGIDARPVDGDYGFAIDSEDSEGGKDVVGFLDSNNVPTTDKGEIKAYSRDTSGTLIASIYLDKTGKIEIVAPNKVNVDTDVIAALVSLVEHKHIDSWGKPTSAPLAQGAPIPSPPATVTIESDIDTATNSKKIDNKQFLSHAHTGVQAGGGTSGGVA